MYVTMHSRGGFHPGQQGESLCRWGKRTAVHHPRGDRGGRDYLDIVCDELWRWQVEREEEQREVLKRIFAREGMRFSKSKA